MPAVENEKDLPVSSDSEDIRLAVKKLSHAYKRSQAVVEQAKEGTEQSDLPGLNVREPDLPAEESYADALRRAEAVLFAAGEPLSAEQIAAVLPPGTEAADVLMDLKKTYAGRGVVLAEVAGKWRFQTAQDLGFLFVEERHQQKKLTQAQAETLAIIAYGQPVTRAEIEAVRGVALSKGTLDVLMETKWIRIKGRRRTPGRPVTYGTTDTFLEHFGLESLDVLPGKADLEAEGLLSDVVPDNFDPLAEAQALLPELDNLEDIVADIAAGEGDDEGFVTDFVGGGEA